MSDALKHHLWLALFAGENVWIVCLAIYYQWLFISRLKS